MEMFGSDKLFDRYLGKEPREPKLLAPAKEVRVLGGACLLVFTYERDKMNDRLELGHRPTVGAEPGLKRRSRDRPGLL